MVDPVCVKDRENVKVYKWSLQEGDVGSPIECDSFRAVSVQIMGGGTVTIEGDCGSGMEPLEQFNFSTVKRIGVDCLQYRPRQVSGSSDVYLMVRR